MRLIEAANNPDIIDEYAIRHFKTMEGVGVGVFTDQDGTVWLLFHGGNLKEPLRTGLTQDAAHALGAQLLRAGGQSLILGAKKQPG
jgi:hypothetical protein